MKRKSIASPFFGIFSGIIGVLFIAHAGHGQAQPQAGDEPAPDPMGFVLTPAYRACLDGLATDIDAGRQAARQWQEDGGGVAAAHCRIMGDLAAAAPKTAAIGLQALAGSDAAVNPARSALLYGQAAEIWLGLNLIDEADRALEQGLLLTPAKGQTGGQLLLLRGRIEAARERWQATVDAITAAEAEGVISADGYVARGRAYKALSRNEDSAEDVVRALGLDAFHLDALVLRGELVQAGMTINTRYRRADDPIEIPATP